MTQKQCANCGELVEATTKVCPECGHSRRRVFALWGILALVAASTFAWAGLIFFPLLFIAPVLALIGVGLLLLAPFVTVTTDAEVETSGHATSD